MYKTILKKREWCKRVALIPVFIAANCVFSVGVFAQNNVNTLNGGVENTNTDKDRMITFGVGVSQELLTEYQEIVNKYLEKYSIGNPEESDKFYWKSDYLSVEDWSRLYVIFVQMTYIQQNEQMISFRSPPPAYGRVSLHLSLHLNLYMICG